MSETYFKAVRPDLTDFRTGRVKYDVGSTVTHPRPHRRDASGYLSVSVVPTDCVGAAYPLRLLEVTAVDVWTDAAHPNKRCTHELVVVREVDAALVFGPPGQAVIAFIKRCKTLTYDECRVMVAARAAARDAAWGAAWGAARAAAPAAAWGAARVAAWGAAWDAARGLLVRDLIGDSFTQEQYDLLTGPWRKTIGPIHPDDAELRAEVPA